MVTRFYERNDGGVQHVATLQYPDVWVMANESTRRMLDTMRFMIFGGKFDYTNKEHHALLPHVISGSRLWAVGNDITPPILSDSTKIRNWNVDDERNCDWIKLLLRLRGKKEDEVEENMDAVEVKKLPATEPEKPNLLHRIGDGLRSLLRGDKVEDAKEATYQVQPFHGNYYLEENKPWAMSPDDENAILKKGGWKLYKEMHLVCDCTDNPTPERKSAYTYPVAKLVNGKPTYFLTSAQTVYAGLRGGARGAKLPSQVNEDALKTVKKIYEAFGRETEEMALKAGNFITTEGRVVFVGGPGSGGGGAGGGASGTVIQQTTETPNLGGELAALKRHTIKLPKDTRKLNVNESFAALNQMGCQVKPGTFNPRTREMFYELTDRNGVTKSVGAQEVRRMIYDSAKKELPCFAFKSADGSDWWMQWTTNAFTDREGEIFQTKALNEFVERHRDERVKGEFWYHHVPGTKFGDVLWQAMVGRFLVQAGPFDATPVGQAFKEFFVRYPDGHPEIAPGGWGTSHGYQYDSKDRQDGVYEWVEIHESTVLPADAASNPWSLPPRIMRRSDVMNAQERKELETIGGKKLVDLVLKEGEQRTKELEGRGVGYKSLETGMAKLMALMEGVEDQDIKAALSEIYADLESPDEEVPTEDALLEGEIEEEVTEEVTEEMLPEGIEEGEAACSKPAGATKAEVGDALKAVVQQLRGEIAASQKATTDTITQALKPLVETVTELKKRDSEKIAQKAAATPAASLRDMVQSVLDSPAAAVKENDPLRGRKPEEAPMQNVRPTEGLPPFLASLLSGK